MSDTIKQNVQWFPGHMAKTRRLIKESLPLVDAVTEILDARMPESSRNPELSELIENKPRIVLLNKCDVADEKATNEWLKYYRNNYTAALAVDCKTGKGLNNYIPLMRDVLADVIQKNEDRGMAGKPLRIMVVGIPNTGKSSFINKMAGRNRAKVADKAGVTRHNQWFVIDNGVELLDTPGVLWPKFDDPKIGDKLAFIGSVKDDIVDSQTLAIRLLEVLKNDYADRLTNRYKVENFNDLQAYELLELIGKKRGMMIRGGEIDCERASVMLLDEYRGGLLGKITLDRVSDIKNG
ncbi:MAG: ribosome biogenesis GTPase YlqF [Oscillospiraceae bacterium]